MQIGAFRRSEAQVGGGVWLGRVLLSAGFNGCGPLEAEGIHLDGYSRWDAGLGFRLGRSILLLECRNVTGAEILEGPGLRVSGRTFALRWRTASVQRLGNNNVGRWVEADPTPE